MDDSISRELTIDTLKTHFEYGKRVVGDAFWHDDTVLDIISSIPTAQPRWIPVTERLPEEEGTYMVTDYAGGISEVAPDEWLCCDDGTHVWMYSQNVVAWMSLPTAYTEEQE